MSFTEQNEKSNFNHIKEDIESSNKPEDETKPCQDFDEILELVGKDGKYQKFLHYGFLLPYVSIVPFFVINTVFMLYEPDHWCHVPGKDSEMSIEDWKNLTIPKNDAGPFGQDEYPPEKCYMYENMNGTISKTAIECKYGWEYDRTDYTETIPSEFDWVCSKAHFAMSAFTAYYAGCFIGAFVLGGLGDKIGRKLVFLIANIMIIFFRGVSLFIPQHFYLFVFMQFLIGTGNPMMYIAPLTILTEICSNEYRSWIFASVWMIWVLGLSIIPLFAWLAQDWFTLGIITTVPGILSFIFYKYLPESPRWLLSVGRLVEAGQILKKIAHVNGTTKNIKVEQIEKMLKDLRKEQRKSGTKDAQPCDLCSKRSITKNTFILCIVWCVNSLIYYGIILNTTSMAGNQFLNFFILSIIELPTGAMARVFVEKYGRRWSHVVILLVCALGFFIAAISVSTQGMDLLVISAVIISKMGVSMTTLIAHLQVNEVFPTRLRSTASGFVAFIGQFVVICAPMLIYLNKFHPSTPYIGLGITSVIGVIATSFLPETLNQTLPETMEDVNERDEHSKYWSYLPNDYKKKHELDSVKSGNKPNPVMT